MRFKKQSNKKNHDNNRDIQLAREYRALGDVPSKKFINKLLQKGDIKNDEASKLSELINFDLQEKIEPILNQFQPIVRKVLEELSGIENVETKYSIRALRNQDARIYCTQESCNNKDGAYVDVNGDAIDVEG